MMKPVLSLLLFVAFCCGTTAVFAQQTVPEEGFVPIFNGKNLADWEGHPKLWRVENGAIVGETGAEGETKLAYNSFLVWKKGTVGNFVLRFEFRLGKGGNSGLQYRAWNNPDPSKSYSLFGYQADFDGNNKYTGIVYGEGFRGILAKRGTRSEIGDDHKPKVVETFATDEDLKAGIKTEDWNTYEVIAEDFTFTHKVNGKTMSILLDNDTEKRVASGLLAFQAHVGPPMKVEIRNIRIKKQ